MLADGREGGGCLQAVAGLVGRYLNYNTPPNLDNDKGTVWKSDVFKVTFAVWHGIFFIFFPSIYFRIDLPTKIELFCRMKKN